MTGIAIVSSTRHPLTKWYPYEKDDTTRTVLRILQCGEHENCSAWAQFKVICETEALYQQAIDEIEVITNKIVSILKPHMLLRFYSAPENPHPWESWNG